MKPNTSQKGQQKGQGPRSRVVLGVGDYVSSEAPNPWARVLFLRAVTHYVPEAWTSLVSLDPGDEAQLQEWAARWSLTDKWLIDFARKIAPVWRETPESVGLALFGSGFSWAPHYPAPVWDGTSETEASYRAKVKDYISRVKAAPGQSNTPTKETTHHFEWLALYHVGGRQLPQIAEMYQETYPDEYDGLQDGAISEAIHGVAGLIGLTLPKRQGRPRKT